MTTPLDPRALAQESAPSSPIAWDVFFTLFWPAAAAVSLSVAVGGREVSRLGLLSVACGTMAAYGLDRWIDRRGEDSPRLRRALVVGVGFAVIGAAVLACTAWWRFQVCAVLAVIAGAYVPLKRYIPKNLLTVFAWTAATATLPFPEHPAIDPRFLASVVAVALIMAANTLLCDLPDVATDRRDGVVGIAPKFGARAGAIAAAIFGSFGAAAAASVGATGLAVTAMALAILALLCLRHLERGILRLLADGVIVVLPGPLTLLAS